MATCRAHEYVVFVSKSGTTYGHDRLSIVALRRLFIIAKHLTPTAPVALTLMLFGSAPLAKAQTPRSRELVVRVTDTSGVVVPGARLFLLPDKRPVRTDAKGEYTFINLRRQAYRLEINRLGFAPGFLNIESGDTRSRIEVQLKSLPQELDATVISERQGRLARVYERQAKHLGFVVFAADIPRYRAFSVPDLFARVPEFYRMLNRTVSCRNKKIFVDGRNVPPGWGIEEYVTPQEIMAIEVHASADFIHEDFLKFEPDAPGLQPSNKIGVINLGSGPPRVSQSLSGTCNPVVLIWTWWYRPSH